MKKKLEQKEQGTGHTWLFTSAIVLAFALAATVIPDAQTEADTVSGTPTTQSATISDTHSAMTSSQKAASSSQPAPTTRTEVSPTAADSTTDVQTAQGDVASQTIGSPKSTPVTPSAAAAQLPPTAPQGTKIADNRYVTVTGTSFYFYKDFYWTLGQSASSVYGQTLHSTGIYHHSNGSTYLSLFDNRGQWLGYINADAVTVAQNQRGAWVSDDEYATMTKAGQPIYSDLNGTSAQQSDSLLNKTYKVTGKYNAFDGSQLLSLYDNLSKWVGYIDRQSASVGNDAQGVWQPFQETARVVNGSYEIWASFDFLSGHKASNYSYVSVNGQYHHANGSTYYSIYNGSTGSWLGYVNSQAVEKMDSAQGAKIPDNQYVTITSKAYPLYSDFYWNVQHAAGSGYQWTFKSIGKYNHINGHTYLSLINSQNVWQGYIDERAVTKAAGHQGAWLPASGYTTFINQNISSSSDFDGKLAESGSALFGNTYAITGEYRDFDWRLIYSIYDSRNKWHGYVNSDSIGITNRQEGLKLDQGGYATTTQLQKTIWYSFDYVSGWHTSSLYQKTYQIQGKYHAFNGNTYYSLWNNNGDWLGYVNASFVSYATGAQGAWLSNSFRVTLNVPNYPVWSSFFGNQVGNSSLALGHTYDATGRYSHFNGSTYYSLYESGKWIGYINADAATPIGTRTMNVPWISQITPYMAKDACAAVNLEMLLAWKGKDPGHYTIISNLPQAPYPGGQVGDPFTGKGWRSVIEPKALADYGNRFYDGFADISGASMNQIIAEVLNGHPVLYYGWTPYQTPGDVKRNHTHCIIGYDPQKGFLVTDPAYSYASQGAKSETGRSTDLGAISWRSVAYVAMEYGKSYGSEKVKRAIVMY